MKPAALIGGGMLIASVMTGVAQATPQTWLECPITEEEKTHYTGMASTHDQTETRSYTIYYVFDAATKKVYGYDKRDSTMTEIGSHNNDGVKADGGWAEVSNDAIKITIFAYDHTVGHENGLREEITIDRRSLSAYGNKTFNGHVATSETTLSGQCQIIASLPVRGNRF